VPDADDKEPHIGPITAYAVNKVTPSHFAEKRGNYYQRNHQQHAKNKCTQCIKTIDQSQESHVCVSKWCTDIIIEKNTTSMKNIKKPGCYFKKY
jgi:hypothetical protein